MRRPDLKASAKSALLKPARFFNQDFAYLGRLEMNFARGALTAATRDLDALRPQSWEFTACSQNGEDGIIDHLLSGVTESNRYFVEIGASDGIENNSSYLAFAKKYEGLMVEGDARKSEKSSRFLQSLNWGVAYMTLFVEPTNVDILLRQSLYSAPDFFSLDIDSNDYFVMCKLLESGLRPKVVCVEYNSAFGPDAPLSIAYTVGLNYLTHDPSQLYYGVSIAGWRVLFERYGYRFVTVESRGINAFFVDPAAVHLPDDLAGSPFAENTTQRLRHGSTWQQQFAKISHLEFVEVRAPLP